MNTEIMHHLQQKLYELIQLRGLRHFNSLRELGELIGEKHPQKVKHHLLQLEKDDYIKINWDKYRFEPSAFQNEWDSMIISIPIFGAANCGFPTIFAEENPEGIIMVSKNMIKTSNKKLFALKAVGNSMNEADVYGKTIEDGDFIIIDPEDKNAIDGDYVLSIINGAANIKKFQDDRNRNNCIILYSESTQDYSPIFIHADDNPDYFVGGKVISVIKQTKKIAYA